MVTLSSKNMIPVTPIIFYTPNQPEHTSSSIETSFFLPKYKHGHPSKAGQFSNDYICSKNPGFQPLPLCPSPKKAQTKITEYMSAR